MTRAPSWRQARLDLGPVSLQALRELVVARVVGVGQLVAHDDGLGGRPEQRVAGRVRAPMLHRLKHRGHLAADVPRAVPVDDPCDSTHTRRTFRWSVPASQDRSASEEWSPMVLPRASAAYGRISTLHRPARFDTASPHQPRRFRDSCGRSSAGQVSKHRSRRACGPRDRRAHIAVRFSYHRFRMVGRNRRRPGLRARLGLRRGLVAAPARVVAKPTRTGAVAELCGVCDEPPYGSTSRYSLTSHSVTSAQ